MLVIGKKIILNLSLASTRKKTSDLSHLLAGARKLCRYVKKLETERYSQ